MPGRVSGLFRRADAVTSLRSSRTVNRQSTMGQDTPMNKNVESCPVREQLSIPRGVAIALRQPRSSARGCVHA